MAGIGKQRDRVLTLVRDSLEPLDAAVIARSLGIHSTTARFHLNALIDDGLVEGTWLPSATVGRPRKGYLAVGADPLAAVLDALLHQLGDTPEARRAAGAVAGRAWADGLSGLAAAADGVPDPVVVVVTALTRLGFRIETTVSAFGVHDIRMCNCPLRRIARGAPEIVVGVQQGLIERVLERNAAVLAAQYDVDVRPDAGGECGLTLRLSGRAPHRASATT